MGSMKGYEISSRYHIRVYQSDASGRYLAMVKEYDCMVWDTDFSDSRDEVFEQACNWIDKQVERQMSEMEDEDGRVH